MPLSPKPLRIFCSVAPEDENFCAQLHEHLRPLERQGRLDVWYPRLIVAGTDWTREVDTRLADASIILLLISSAFFASDYCYGVEMQTALRRHRANEARVIPILLRPVDWEAAPFAHLATLPDTKTFLTAWPDRDRAFANIAAGIRRVIEERLQSPQETSAVVQSHAWDHLSVQHASEPEPIMFDLMDAPHVEHFYGREEARSTITHWVNDERCRILSIIGMGGIGKTSLAAKIVQQVSPTFQTIFWYSLLNAPPLERFLQDYLHFLMRDQPIALPQAIEEQMRLLVIHLHQRRCLLILDNAEALLKSGSSRAEYKEGYEEYGTLMRRFGETRHQSCVIVTSREQLKEMVWLEGEATSVRSYRLEGLQVDEARIICERKGVSGDDASWSAFIGHFFGNPIMLMIVSSIIRESYGGRIAPYLAELGDVAPYEYPDLRALLEKQFERQAPLEQEIMYWFATERVALSLQEVRDVHIQAISKGQILTAIEALRRRSLIEQSEAGRFTLQPAMMDAVLNRFLDHVVQEILVGNTALCASHALIKAQAKNYIRESQRELILNVIAQQLITLLGKATAEERLRQRLAVLRHLPEPSNSYEAGNILNILIQMGSDLCGLDCSGLIVRQAYLQEIDLPAVNFAHASLATSVFTDTFGGIVSVAWSLQGDRLAAGTATGEIRIWDASSGLPLQTFWGHTDWVWSVVFSPDGRTLASGSADQTVRLWEVESGHCLTILRDHAENVWSVAISPDGKKLASGGADHVVRLWEIESGHCLSVLHGHTDIVRSVAFSPDGKKLASGSSDPTIRVWNVLNSQCLLELIGHTSSVRSVAFSPDGKLLASGSSDQAIRVWKMKNGHCMMVLQGHGGAIRSVVFSPDGRQLASGGFDRHVRVWEIESGRCTAVLQGHTNAVWSVAFSPDGEMLASGSEDQTVRLWETRRGLCLQALHGYSRGIWSAAFRPDGNALVSGGSDRMVRVWEIESGQCSAVLRGHSDGIWSVAWSSDGELLASGSADQTVCVWERRNSRCLHTLRGHTQMLFSVAFSPDGDRLASGSADQTVRLWEPRSGQCLHTLRGHTDAVRSVAFSPDGQILASASKDQTIRLWDVLSGECVAILTGHQQLVSSVAFSPDGLILASGSKDQTVRLWDIGRGQLLHTLRGHQQWVFAVAFSPDGQVLASGSGDQTIRLWDVNRGQHLLTLSHGTNAVRSVAFSPDGQMIVSGYYDGGMDLWKRATGEHVRTLMRNRPYEQMNITSVQGLTELQKRTIKSLGAIEEEGT